MINGMRRENENPCEEGGSLKKIERSDEGGRGQGVGHQGFVLASAAGQLLVAGYVLSTAKTINMKWAALTLLLLGVCQLVVSLHGYLGRTKRQERFLQAILSSVPHVLSYKDTSFRYQGINREFERTFNLRAEDVIGKGDAELFGQALYERFLAQDREVLATGQARTFYEEMSIDGRIRSIESRKAPFYSVHGTPLGVVGLAIDVTEHQHLRQQLEVSNARLNIALRAAQMGTWAWDTESDEWDLDASERQLFGLGDGRYMVADFWREVHPDDVESLKEVARRALREDVAVDYEFRAPSEEGGWHWVEGSVIRYCVPGKSTCLIGVNRDISQRKQQELELTEAKQRAERALTELEQSRMELDLALRSGRLGVWHSTRDADISPRDMNDEAVDWDVNVRRTFGRGIDEPVTRRQFFEALHPEDRERVLAGLAEAYHRNEVHADHGGGEYADQYRIVRPDGCMRAIAVSAAPSFRIDPDTGKRQFRMTGIVRDITEEEDLKADLRQKANEAQQAANDLEQARAELELALRSAQLGAWHSEFRDVGEADRLDEPSLDDPIVWDANVRRIYGIGPDESVTRRHFFEAIYPEDRERVLANLAQAANQGIDYMDQYRVVLRDGEVRWVAVHATFVWRRHADGGKVRWMTGIARDVTEEEGLKIDLRQKVLEARLATEAKARFLAMMSHEIRTPMNGVVGMIELLLETPLSSEQQQMLKTCKDSAFVLLTVLNDILDFSKIEAGKLELDYARLSPRRLAESVGEALGIHATQRGIDLDIKVNPEVPRRVIGDRVRLRQILTNLVSNAIKFTEQGGVVVAVSLEQRESDDHRMRIRFDVSDSGIGMDEETIRNLFQPFQQADAATTRSFGGTGLGLSIVKYLTELMEGEVECESRLLQGSRFSVVIPFEGATASEDDWGYSIAGVRVLALGARELRQQIISGFLAQFDASVKFFDHADELLAGARQAAEQGLVDLILLDRDCSISECAGIRRYFTEAPGLSHLPFVVVRSKELVQVQLIPDAILVHGNPLIRASLIQSIAMALGKISASVQTAVVDRADDTTELLSRDREEAAGRLILLAEDNPTNRELISRQLARLGYLCDVAEDGARAWKMLKSGAARYALLLTDCHMPRLDGYELTRRIRTLERSNGGPCLPIVAITANVLQGEGERCMDIGMNGYLAKPLQIRDLRKVLSELLPAPIVGLIASGSEAASKSTSFRELADILGGDEERLRHVLGVFERSTRNDCDLLDAAYAVRDRKRVRELAHKLKSGCSQLGESIAAQELESLEVRTKGDAKFDDEFAAARRELDQVLARVSAHLGTE